MSARIKTSFLANVYKASAISAISAKTSYGTAKAARECQKCHIPLYGTGTGGITKL